MKSFDSYGAALLGAALRTLFPKANHLGTAVDSRGFSAVFSDDAPFQEGYLSMLQETMQKLSEEPIQIMEMLGSNAMELLSHHEQPCRRKLKETVWVVKLGSLFEVCDLAPEVARDFVLLSFSKEKKQVTIWGKAFPTPQAKQQYEKQYRKWINHREIAEKLELYEGAVQHPRGMLLKHFLNDFRRKFFQEYGFVEIDTDHPHLYAKKHHLKRLICRDLFYDFSEGSLNSLLQIIEKWVNIFEFEWTWAFGSKKPRKEIQNALDQAGIPFRVDRDASHSFLELQVFDFLGCRQRVARVDLLSPGFTFFFEEVDEWIALLLEKDRGELPQWLAPEQVRLLTETGVKSSQVTKIFRIADIRYTIDQGEESLKEKMYRALRVNVPYVMVFGNREEKANHMMIRASSSGKNETISLTQLPQFLSELQIESE